MKQKKSFFQNEQLIIGIIVLATALVYFNSLNNRFVYDEALEQTNIVKSENPGNTEVFLALGGIYLQNKQFA